MRIKYYSVVFLLFFIVFLCVSSVNKAIAKEYEIVKKKENNVEISTPTFTIQNKNLEKILNNKLEEIKEYFISSIDDGPATLNITSKEFYYDKYVSYAFFIETYSGGAHPNTTMWTIVYDLELNKEITLDYLIKQDNDFDNVQKSVQSDFLYDPRITNVIWMLEGTSKKNDFQNFVFTNEGVIFYFIPYQIAPYSNGILSSHVNYKKEWLI